MIESLCPKEQLENIEIDITDIEAVLFDMDGTLTDTRKEFAEAWNEVITHTAEKYSSSKFNPHNYVVDFSSIKPKSGQGGKALFKPWIEAVDGDERIFRQKVFDDFFDLIRIRFATISGFANLLPDAMNIIIQFIKRRRKLGLVTSGTREQVLLFTGRYNLPFGTKIAREDVGEDNLKPNPIGFIMGIENLHKKPHRCMVFEDSIDGVKAAIDAKARIIVRRKNPDEEPLPQNLKIDATHQGITLYEVQNFDQIQLVDKKSLEYRFRLLSTKWNGLMNSILPPGSVA